MVLVIGCVDPGSIHPKKDVTTSVCILVWLKIAGILFTSGLFGATTSTPLLLTIFCKYHVLLINSDCWACTSPAKNIKINTIVAFILIFY